MTTLSAQTPHSSENNDSEPKKHILVTGANGYIGRRLIAALLDEGHNITALVRSQNKFRKFDKNSNEITYIQGDLTDPSTLNALNGKFDAAYYLVHSMTTESDKLIEKEVTAAKISSTP